jgi:hypothetical protein
MGFRPGKGCRSYTVEIDARARTNGHVRPLEPPARRGRSPTLAVPFAKARHRSTSDVEGIAVGSLCRALAVDDCPSLQ